jgi:exodeoxyribonuclease V alpha subunit
MEKCEEILLRQNLEGNPTDRRCGQIVRKIWDMMNERAWTGVSTKIMKSLFKDITTHQKYLISEFKVKLDYDTFYLNYPFSVEGFVADRLEKLIRMNKVNASTPFDTHLRESANFKCQTLTDEQKKAIQGALDYNVTIITGGAGHGKSKIIEEIVHNNDLRNINTCMAAFTGKAVSRIREVTGRRSPSTLHRLIYRANMTPKFTHLIIDEASMVTTELFCQFLKAFKDFYKITLVGDINQLQPIGWGTLFEELIKSSVVPVYRLTVNHRVEKIQQYIVPGMNNEAKEEKNGIIINSQNIITATKGKSFRFKATKNFAICNENVEHVADILTQLHNSGVPSKDITVITPYNKDVEGLNKMAQEIFNDGKESVVDSRGTLWMVGDRVMLTENNYDINVFNGETGDVTDVNDMFISVVFGDGATRAFLLEKPAKEEIDKVKLPKVRQEGDLVSPDKDEEDELYVTSLIHSFAITVHRSQGSEFPYCIIYVPPNGANSSFLTRNLLYVAVSRAKKACWVVSPVLDSVQAAAHRLPSFRCENLCARLKTAFPSEEDEVVENVDDVMMYI